jgi:hypothetical protein
MERMISRLQLPSLVDEVLSLSVDLSGGLCSSSSLNLGSGLGQNSLFGVVHFAKLVEINVRSLDDLDLSDLDVLDGVDGGDLLGDLLLNDLTGEEVEDLSGVGFSHFLSDNVVDSLSDDFLLGGKSVVGLSLLVGGLPGEGNHEHSQDISVLGLDVLDGLNQGLSLLDEGAQLVTSNVNTVEGSDGLSAFGLIDDQLDFSPVEAVLVGSEIGLHLFDNSALDAVFDLF